VKVLLIGKTEVDLFPFQGDSRHHMPGKAEGSEFEKRVQKDAVDSPFNYGTGTGQDLIEFAGRLCYESFDLPNEATKTNDAYVRNIVAQGHESVLEHVSVTFYIEGVSRNLTHELIRHRHLSFSELSQRFVDMEQAKVIVPPAWGGGERPLPTRHKAHYKLVVDELKAQGKTRKQAREAARYGLPQGTETKLVVSGNLRAWRDVLKKRLSVHADAEIQELANKIWEILSQEYPDVFADIEYQEN
jgi:thymidylate synthase (FAD)